MIGLLLHRGKIAEVIQLLGNFTLMASSKSEGWKFKISGPNVLIRACLKSIPSIFKLTSAPEKKEKILILLISLIPSHFWKADFDQIISVGRKNRTFFFIFDLNNLHLIFEFFDLLHLSKMKKKVKYFLAKMASSTLTFCLFMLKGQQIWKAIYGVLNSSNKRTKHTILSIFAKEKMLRIVWFIRCLEELGTP